MWLQVLRGTWFEIDDGGKREGSGEIGVAALWHTNFWLRDILVDGWMEGQGGEEWCVGVGKEAKRTQHDRVVAVPDHVSKSVLLEGRGIDCRRGGGGRRKTFGMWVRRWCWIGGGGGD